MRSDCKGPPERAGVGEATEPERRGMRPKMSECLWGGKRRGGGNRGDPFSCGRVKQMVIVKPLPEDRTIRTQFRA